MASVSGATALEAFTGMVLPRHPESPSSLTLGNGLASSLPSIGMRSLSTSGLPHMGSFGGSLNLEEILGELAQAQSTALGFSQPHQQSQLRDQHRQADPQQRLADDSQRPRQHQPQRLLLPPTSFSFPASQPRGSMDGVKNTEEIWRSIHDSLHGGGFGSGAWSSAPDGMASNRRSGEGSTPRLGSSLASVPSAATHFAPPAGGSVGALTGRNASAVSGSRAMSSAGISSSVGGMPTQSGSTEMASHMAAAVAAGADPSWFPQLAGSMGLMGGNGGRGGSGGGLPSLDHALQTVAASRSQHWAAQAAMASRVSASGSSNPTFTESAALSYGRGHLGGQQRGTYSLEPPPFAAIAPAGHGVDLRSGSMDTAMELTRSLQQKFMTDNGRESAAACSQTYLPQQYLNRESMNAPLGEYPGTAAAGTARHDSPSVSQPPPRFNGAVAATTTDAPMTAAQRRGGRAPRGASSLPSAGSDALSMPAIPPASAQASRRGGSHGLANGGSAPAALGGSISARERHKLTKGRTVEIDEKELRDMKRKEANRESAARSRDKRLKLIADLETEVQQLKRQHEAFKERVIQTTVPRELVEAPVKKHHVPLRRANTDPLDTAHRIAEALGGSPLDPTKMTAATRAAALETMSGIWSSNGRKVAGPLIAGLSCDGLRSGSGLASLDSTEMHGSGSTAEPASRAEAALLRVGRV